MIIKLFSFFSLPPNSPNRKRKNQNSNSKNHSKKPKNDFFDHSSKESEAVKKVGVVEPRVVVRIPKKHLDDQRKTCSDFRISSEEESCSDEEEIGTEPAKKNNFKAKESSINFSLKTPDDQWIYCQVRGCSFWTRKPERMVRHSQCHRPDTKYYKCPDCSLRFYSLAKMLKHDRKVHTGVKDYECRVCEAEVTDIQIHMRVRILKILRFFN